MRNREGFSQCLVDGDEQSLERARRVRRRALLASIIFEAALLAALLLWPLITPGELTRQFFVTPAPPYHSGPVAAAPGSSRPAPRNHPEHTGTRIHDLFVQPTNIPLHVPESSPEEASGDNSIPGFGSTNIPGGGSGTGDYIPGGSDGGQPLLPIPPPARPEKPRPMSEGVMQAVLIHRVQPQYPTPARLMHVAGTVRLQAIIGKDGSVRELAVLSGNPILAQAAVAAVREWRYQPTQLNNEPVEVITYITVNFVLE